jgi:hypothetical protein
MFAREQMWVPHICPVLADVGKAEGPVSNRWSPVSFFPITSAVHDVRKAVPASHLAESPSNSAVSVTNAAVSQLTSPQSSKPNSAEIESDSAASVSNSAESDLIEARAVNCCRARQHCETPMQSITEPQRGGGWGVGGGSATRQAGSRLTFCPSHHRQESRCAERLRLQDADCISRVARLVRRLPT